MGTLALPFVFTRLLDFALQSRFKNYSASSEFFYHLDLFSTQSKLAKPFLLIIITLWLILVSTLLLHALSSDATASITHVVWDAMLGIGLNWSFVQKDVHSSIYAKIVGLFVALGGMMVTALLIEIVGDLVENKMDELRQGKSNVFETNHTVILGWSDKLVPLIRELAFAQKDASRKRSIVILAEMNKMDMEERLRRAHIHLHGTLVICRSGDPLLIENLVRVSVSYAQNIVILSQPVRVTISGTFQTLTPSDSDAWVIRSVMTLCEMNNKENGIKGFIVAEVAQLDNEAIIKDIGGSLVETIVSHAIMGRLMIQCARHPGLASVYHSLLGFEGSEFYFQTWNDIEGVPFREVMLRFSNAIPVGIRRFGIVHVNPPDAMILKKDDEVLVIAEDFNSYKPDRVPGIELDPSNVKINTNLERPTPEAILICGWRRDVHDMLRDLDMCVHTGSVVYIFASMPIAKRKHEFLLARFEEYPLKNLRVEHRVGNPRIKAHLETLPLDDINCILIVSDESTPNDPSVNDSNNVATLVFIRELQYKSFANATMRTRSRTNTRTGATMNKAFETKLQRMADINEIIIDIWDNRSSLFLRGVAGCEFVLSKELVSMQLAMILENRNVCAVLHELYNSRSGSEITMRSITTCVHPGESVSFFDIMVRVRRQKQEIVIGYWLFDSMSGPCLNPPDKATPREWKEYDEIIVLTMC